MSDTAQLQAEAQRFRDDFQRLRDSVGRVIIGQQRVVDGVLTAIVAGGNVLLEGVPGLGKTELVKTLARALDLDFRRIQFTPDLMPADIIGTTVMSAGPDGRYQFEFRRGPVFTQLLLADEINRATPKTQSALLETMQEGTYPFPEAQLDRFMFKLNVPFLNRAELNEMVRRTTLGGHSDVPKIMSGDRIMELRTVLEKVVVADPLRDYAVRLVLTTHPETVESSDTVKKFVKWGASPRAVQAAHPRRAGARTRRGTRACGLRGHPPFCPRSPRPPRAAELRRPRGKSQRSGNGGGTREARAAGGSMTLKEMVLLVLGFFAACGVLLTFLTLIVRCAQNKQPKHDQSEDHYHESGTGLNG